MWGTIPDHHLREPVWFSFFLVVAFFVHLMMTTTTPQFLAAFQQFERMNLDEAGDGGAGNSGGSPASSARSDGNSRRLRPSIFSYRAEQPSPQQLQPVEQRCAYQVRGLPVLRPCRWWLNLVQMQLSRIPRITVNGER